MGSTSQLVIDIPDNLETTFSPDLCIYKVPTPLRKVKEAAYTPQVISIGPIHHMEKYSALNCSTNLHNKKNQVLSDMEVQKMRYLKEFCKRLDPSNDNITRNQFLNKLCSIIQGNEGRIRRCYSESLSEVCSSKFVRIILMDAVFILELFLRSRKQQDYKDDFIVAKPWLKTLIQQDLILLENQLPYFILKQLYDLSISKFRVNNGINTYISFLDLTCEYFSNYKPSKKPIQTPTQESTILHFADLVRYFWSYGHPAPHNQTKGLHCVTKLREAGVKFKLADNSFLLEINFEQGKKCELQIPCFKIDDSTERIVRNLMALEQCHYPAEAYICNYITLIDFLVDTVKDVDLLVEKKIILNCLGNNAAVANMINKLCLQITVENNCYYPLYEQLNNHYKSRFNRSMANLRRVYFNNLWTGTGTTVGAIFLFLGFIQTICSILQVKGGH